MKTLKAIFNIKVLAVLFAIGLWYYVNVTQGPVISKTFKNVPIVPINVPTDSYVSNSIAPIQVVAEGPSKIILGLKDTDFVASVNVANKNEGDYLLPVEVKSPVDVVKIKSYTPNLVRVVVESISTKKFAVVSDFINPSTDTKFFPSIPTISPSSVIASGPKSQLNRIKRLFVAVDLSKVVSNTILTLPVQYETYDGGTLQNVYFNPSTVVVDVNISTDTGLLTVPIVPTILNNPPSNFAIRNITLNPAVITISGPINLLTNIKSISTEPIDVSLLTSKTELNVKLQTIDGITLPFNSCKVTLDVQPLITKVFTLQINVKSPQNRQVSLTQTTVNVLVSGFKDSIESLTSDSFTCFVDASNLDSGTYTLPVNVTLSKSDVILQSVLPASVEVKVY